MSKSLWIITDRIGWALDAWKEVRGSFLLGLFGLAVALHLATIAGAIAWFRFLV